MKTLHDAANPEEMLKMLAEGADVNCKNREGITPLHQLSSEGHTGGVRILLDAGADVNANSNLKSTPLHKACENGRSEVVHMLLESGADCNASDSDGATPLHYGAMHKSGDVTRMLLDAGANANAETLDGVTPLRLVASTSTKSFRWLAEAVEKLKAEEKLKVLENSDDPQDRLNHAVITRDIDRFKQAVENGADLHKDVDRETAYSFHTKGMPIADDAPGYESAFLQLDERTVATFVELEEQDILEFEESGLNVDRARLEFTKGALEIMGQSMGNSSEQSLFDASNLSAESAAIYKASLSRNVQATNEAVDQARLQAEPEQRAYAQQGDHLDMKLDKAGEAAYQASLRTKAQALADSWHPGMKDSAPAAAPESLATQQASNVRRQSSGFQM